MPYNFFINLHTYCELVHSIVRPLKRPLFGFFWCPCIFVQIMSPDKSFETESGDQDDWKFILQASYFCCHLQSEYTHTQRANVQRWILSAAQNYAMRWCHRFFKTLFECLDLNVVLDKSFYL